MMSFEQDDFDENEQPCCLNPDIFTNDDEIRVCRNCGMTFGQTFVDSEQRAYTSEEVLARRTSGTQMAIVRSPYCYYKHQCRCAGTCP